MKNINDILKDIGIEVPADKQADLDKQVLENYKTVADYDKQKQKLDAGNAKIQELTETMKTLEANKGNTETLQAELEKYKKAEADRVEAEKQAAADNAFADRFTTVAGESKFINELTKNGLLSEFKKAVADEANKGKGDKDIFESLTKDRENIFVNENEPGNIPGAGGGAGGAVDDAAIRAVMGLPPLK